METWPYTHDRYHVELAIFYRKLVEIFDAPVPVSSVEATRVTELLDAAWKSSSEGVVVATADQREI